MYAIDALGFNVNRKTKPTRLSTKYAYMKNVSSYQISNMQKHDAW